jgi:hypothetical protein
MQLTSPNMQMKHKLENDPSDIVSFKDVFPAFREIGEKHSRVDFFLTPILANDGQAEEISEYAEKFGITSFKYYLYDAPGGFRLAFSETNRVFRFRRRNGVPRHGTCGAAWAPCIGSLHCENWGIVRVLEERLKKRGEEGLWGMG